MQQGNKHTYGQTERTKANTTFKYTATRKESMYDVQAHTTTHATHQFLTQRNAFMSHSYSLLVDKFTTTK